MALIKDIIRGSGYLPHVGPHPGTPFVLMMGGLSILAGLLSDNLVAALLWIIGAIVFFGGIFATGSASRARLSDRLCAKHDSDDIHVQSGRVVAGDLVGRRTVNAAEDHRSPGCVIEIRDGKVTVNGQPHESGRLKGVVEIRITQGTPVSLSTDASVVCQDVQGNVSAGSSVNCGDVGGSVSAGSSVNCDDVGGSVSAGGSVNRS